MPLCVRGIVIGRKVALHPRLPRLAFTEACTLLEHEELSAPESEWNPAERRAFCTDRDDPDVL